MLVKAIPNALTLGNLFLGVAAIILAFQRQYPWAAITVIVGMLLDGLDGKVARMLHAQSDFGKELDSLSDVISFGMAPAFIMYGVVLSQLGWIGIIITAFFPICGALRLARYNVQSGHTNYFIGLPITAAGGVLATLALYHSSIPNVNVVLPLGMVMLAWLMVSRVKYPNFKKVGLPKTTYFMVPLILAAVLVLFRWHANIMNRVVFVPLCAYALFGLQRSLHRRRVKSVTEHEEPIESVTK